MPCKSMMYSVEAVSSPATNKSYQSLFSMLTVLVGSGILIAAARGASAKSNSAAIRPTSSLRRDLRAEIRRTAPAETTLSRPEIVSSVKTSTLTALANTPFVVESAGRIAPSLEALLGATTLAEVALAQVTLTSAVEASHGRVFAATMRAAATRAIKKIGFASVTILSGSVEKVRLVAENDTGKQLHAEIRGGMNGQPAITVEVLRATHEESHQILDALELALTEEGLHSSGPPTRKGSGGLIPVIQPHSHGHTHAHQAHPEARAQADGSRRPQKTNRDSSQRQR